MSQVIDHLHQLQADQLVHYQRLRAYHWFVRGPMFFQLHAQFEQLYLRTAEEVDQLAERSLALGGRPHATLGAALAASRFQEDSELPDAEGMVRSVVEASAQLVGWLREGARVAEGAGDSATFNLLEGMADTNEQDQWMLRAFLDA